ncbi:MAG: hypothetical protein Q8L48_19365 [Archangium sp.]|nr:hypothetical protein [Archangium sp.]
MSEQVMVVVQSRMDVLDVSADARVLAASQGARPRKASELAVVVADLATNAVRHGRGALVKLAVGSAGWTVEVEGTKRRGQADLSDVRRFATRLELRGTSVIAHGEFS